MAKDRFLRGVGGELQPTTSADNVAPFTNASGAVSLGQAVYLSGAGAVAPASATTTGQPAIGFVYEIVDLTNCVVIFGGVFESFALGMTPGDSYYLAEAAGTVQTTPVLGATKLAQYLGRAISATDLRVEPEEMARIGTSAGQLVAVGYDGYLPVLDGRNLTNLATFAVNQATHGLSVGDAIRWNGSVWVQSQANSDANADVDGVVVSSSGPNDFVYGLPWQEHDIYAGMVNGGVYYLSPTVAGGKTLTPPTTAGQINKPLLKALSTTKALILGLRGIEVGATATVQEISASPYTVLAGDGTVLVNMASAIATVNLPAGATHITKLVRIKDKSGMAGLYNITIVPNGAETIDGDTSVTIQGNYGSVTFQFHGTEWSIT